MTPAEFFAQHPRAAARLDARLTEYFATLAPGQQVELETAATDLLLRETVDGGWRLEVGFQVPGGTAWLCGFDAASVGLHVVAGELVYVDDGLSE